MSCNISLHYITQNAEIRRYQRKLIPPLDSSFYANCDAGNAGNMVREPLFRACVTYENTKTKLGISVNLNPLTCHQLLGKGGDVLVLV
jgi:hypothetical protein